MVKGIQMPGLAKVDHMLTQESEVESAPSKTHRGERGRKNKPTQYGGLETNTAEVLFNTGIFPKDSLWHCKVRGPQVRAYRFQPVMMQMRQLTSKEV